MPALARDTDYREDDLPERSLKPQLMNAQTRAAAYQLLAALMSDPTAAAEVEIYGDWKGHLEDQIADSDED